VVCKALCFLDAPKLKAVIYYLILKNEVLISDITKLPREAPLKLDTN
jgi:hypothetical protein